MSTVLRIQELAESLQFETERVVIGMRAEVRACFVALLTGGHVLLEGPPGVAKTLLVRTLAAAIDGDFGRVQFTPDLMPSDVTGTSIFRPGDGSFQFRPGPIFTQLLLCDEINRAPAKTQAALLEAMQEGSVTVDGTSHTLPVPFTVFATMNPLEHEGTYPLPEAQLDRFLFKVLVGYPTAELESRLLAEAHGRAVYASPSALGVNAVTTPAEIQSLRDVVRDVTIREDLCEYVVRLLRATREDGALMMGASPRAGVMILQAAKANAAIDGREFVTPDDVKLVVPAALRHRIMLDPAEELQGATPDEALQRILDRQEVPR